MLRPGHADERAPGVVHPGVVRAGEPAGVAAALGDLRAPVAADVEERADDAVVTAHDDDRPVGDLQAVVVARVAQVARQRDRERRAPEHLLHLGRPALRVAVRGDRDLHLALGLVAGPGVDVGQQPASHVGVRCRLHVQPPLKPRPIVLRSPAAGDTNLTPCSVSRRGPKNVPDRSGAPRYSWCSARQARTPTVRRAPVGVVVPADQHHARSPSTVTLSSTRYARPSASSPSIVAVLLRYSCDDAAVPGDRVRQCSTIASRPSSDRSGPSSHRPSSVHSAPHARRRRARARRRRRRAAAGGWRRASRSLIGGGDA